jgi:hypothetical protein
MPPTQNYRKSKVFRNQYEQRAPAWKTHPTNGQVQPASAAMQRRGCTCRKMSHQASVIGRCLMHPNQAIQCKAVFSRFAPSSD